MELILASNSPRRKQLLSEYGFIFSVIPSDFDENEELLSPVETVKSYALGKAKDVFDKTNGDAVVLGADTIVVLDGKILGKPKDNFDAKNMLEKLSNKSHQVITGYCIYTKNKIITDYITTIVKFNELTDELIDKYVATGSPLDKAGAYGIQDGFNLVKKIDGSYNNVVGLPIEIIKDKLNELL